MNLGEYMNTHTKSKPETQSSVEKSYWVPEWAKHVVWYQIFPERFRNGDLSNDPNKERIGAPDDWKLSPWTGDWYERSKWEESFSESFRKAVFKRRYGGDLQGIIEKLDYLQDLGVGGLYLNPVFDAKSLHKYDTSYYHHVDRFFGPDPEGDATIMEQETPNDPSTWQWTAADKLLLKLIEEVHARGMKIIIDGVFNHTGTDFWAFRDLLQKQRKSEFKDWYGVQSFKDSEDDAFRYNSWWDIPSLPSFKEDDGNLVEPVRKHLFDITRRWMDPDGDGDPSDGVDGWRLDVPEEIGKSFWKEWHDLVQSINPEAFTVGEIWTSNSTDWIGDGLFMSSMNYPFSKAVIEYMINRTTTANEFLEKLDSFRSKFPDQAEYALQNLIDSHDTPRLASMIVNADFEFGKNTKPEQGFDVRKPNVQERRIQKLIALFQYTYVGAPMIYYGTEAGMWGADDPDDRKPMVWEEFEYAPESHHPLGEDRPVDENNFDGNLFRYYKTLGHIRNNTPVLQDGAYRKLIVEDEQDLVSFARYTDDHHFAIVILNRSEKPQHISMFLEPFDLDEGGYLRNLLTQTGIQVWGKEQQFSLNLPPLTGAVLVPQYD